MVSPTRAAPARPWRGLPLTDLTMLLVVLIWGANFSVVKLALAELPPLVFSALRFSLAAALLWLLLCWREGIRPLPRGALAKLIILGVVGNTFYQFGFTLGLSSTSAANAALLTATSSAMVALAGGLLGIERLRRTMLAGVGLALGGVTLVLLARGASFSRASMVGDGLILASAACWAAYTLGVRSLGEGISPLAITTWTMITGTPGLLLASAPQMLRLSWARVSPGAWAGLAYSALISLVVAYVLWNSSVRVAGSNRTAIYGCAIPLVAALVAWPALGEQPTPLQAIGAALIVAGVLLTRR
jgi:drug/metabolite transporter (DMT)-like permease